MKINLNIVFTPICWITNIYVAITGFGKHKYTDGHTFVSEYEGTESAYHELRCEICGRISK